MGFVRIFINLKMKICELYKKNKKLFFVAVACVVLIIAVVFMPSFSLTNSDDRSNNSKVQISNDSSYIEKLESKIENILYGLSSVKNVKVLIMSDKTTTNSYLTQKETTTTKNGENETTITKEEIVFEKNGSNQTPILVSTSYPKINGVLIYINKIDASTKVSIQNAISGVLNIEASCIFILQDR